MTFRKKQYLVLFLAFWFILIGVPATAKHAVGRDTVLIRQIVSYLASEGLSGRKAGEPGDSLAAMYISDILRSQGLKPLYTSGLQSFSLVSSVEIEDNNKLSFNNINFEVRNDFLPYSFTANKRVTATALFAGYGFSISEDSLKWNDYPDGLANGKWVLLLKGDPEIDKPQSVFASYSEDRYKVLTAQDNGAAGVLLVAGPEFSREDELQGIFYDKNSSRYSIPVIQINRKTADLLLTQTGKTIEQLEKEINESRKPVVFGIPSDVTAQTEVSQKTVISRNIAALLPGNDPQLKDEYIVIGAHYDHLGMGGPGSGSRMPDTLAVHYGADDNASGVAMVLELARRFAHVKNNRRSIIFAAFGAEEMGLIGATAFTSDPPVELQSINAMFNFDMVGRLDNNSRSLSIGGSQTAVETEELLSSLNKNFAIQFSPEGSGPSDHAAFYMQNIPVFFVSTGAHGDYHTPGDTEDKINYTGMAEIADYMQDVILEVSNRAEVLSFREAGSMSRRSRGGRLKVTLGVMPDFAGQEKAGLRIDAVTKDKPAARAGVMKGDIITSINGNPVGNIYDYMNRLNGLEEGQTISVDIIREGKPLVIIVQL
jgi:hypothetical protein